MSEKDGWDLISSYTRRQAIEDGVLIDVSDTAREAGFKFPVAVTSTVWARYVEVPEGAVPGQDVRGRLWDIVWMLKAGIARTASNDLSQIDYQLYVAMPDRGDWQSNEDVPLKGNSGMSRATHRLVSLKALCGPGAAAEPVITIMLPGED
jgi:hypothetical protein